MSQPPCIIRLNPKDPLPWSLLLLADEAVEAIERYIYQCDIYVLAPTNAPPVGVFALHPNSPEEIELKNLAVDEPLQSNGLGSYMLEEIEWIAMIGGYRRLIVGTATVGQQLNFYKKNGFTPFAIRKDFFLENYPNPLFESGEQLRDMVLLEKPIPISAGSPRKKRNNR
jgi:GNAT superfamily N-acetyltransferase